MFYLLMKMFVTSSHLHLKSSTKLLIVKVSVFRKILILTGFFFAQSSLEQVLSQQDCSIFKVEGFMAVLIYPVLTWLSSQEAAW